ncbi:MAG: DNA-deoxyinosine glycosylase [Clostridia bacterium]|nr:DNA-deoxyinosine glycosylase [Clostridia bacterium]
MKVDNSALTHVKHNIAPVYDDSSKILILGSFPSVKSREQIFFYGHPQNRFWKVISTILGAQPPQTVAEKRKMLLDNGIAVWDVVAECDIVGSQDSTIAAVIPNAIDELIKRSQIKAIILNGKTAYNLYMKYLAERIDLKATLLPSTSPANATWSTTKLIEQWSIIKEYVNQEP